MLGTGLVAAQLESTGVTVEDLGLEKRGIRFSNLNNLRRMMLRLASEIKQLSPEVVHSHMVPANLACRLLRRTTEIPVLVCTAHSIIEPPLWKNIAYRLTDRLCDITTNICRAGVERSIRDGRVPPNRILHLPNGVDIDRFKPNLHVRRRVREELGVGDQFVWIALGRFAWEKDWSTMLQAMARLSRQNQSSMLLIAGDGELFERTKMTADSLGLVNRVRFLGLRNDTADLLNAADGYVLSSVVEGLPMVLLEASACGVPVVATSVGGVPEIVEHSVTGFLVEPGQPDSLAKAMLTLCDLPLSARLEMGRAGRRLTMERYALDSIVERWDVLYRRLLAEKGLNESDPAGCLNF